MAMEKNALALFLETLGRVLVLLSNWSALAAFVEANMWHFTDPTNIGFCLWATVVLLLCLVLPTLPLFVKRVRDIRLHFVPKFLLTITSPLLLYCATLPALATQAPARTILLAFSVSLFPFVILWVLHVNQKDDIFSKIFRCYMKTCEIFFPCLYKKNPSTIIPEQYSNPKKQNNLKIEILLALLAFMSVRWVTISINLFYEVNLAAFALMITVTVYAALQALVDCEYCLVDDGATSRKSTGSTVASDVMNETSNTVIDSPSSHSDNMKSVTSDEEACNFSEQQPPNEMSTLTRILVKADPKSGPKTVNSSKIVLIWICVVTSGLGSGSIIMLALWIFSSPFVLCRWSGKMPLSHGVIILIGFALGVIFSIFDPLNRIVLTYTKKPKKAMLRYYCTLLAIFIVLVASSIVLFQESSDSAKFIGANFLSFLLPYMLKLTCKSVEIVTNSTTVTLSKGKCMSALPGIISLIGVFVFFLLHIATVLFINPNFTFLFFANMKLIFGIEIANILLAVIFSSILYFIEILNTDALECVNKDQVVPSSCSDSIEQKWSLYRNKALQLLILALILGTGLGLGPSYHVKECAYQHAKAIEAIQNMDYQNKTTIKVLSWNILLGHDFWGKDNLGCLAPIIQAIQPNVIGLQESDPLPLYWGGKDTLAYLQSYLPNSYSLLSGVRPLKSSLGVGLLTDLSVLAYHSDILPTDTSVNVPHYSVINAVLNLSNYKLPQVVSEQPIYNSTLYVINLHAVFKNWTKPPLSNLSRLQMNSVVEKIKALPVSTPVIVMGDFNLNPYESELDVFYDPNFGFKSALQPERAAPKPKTLLNRFAVVDHIFYRGLTLVSSRTLNETDWISDHRPIFAEFKLA